MKLAMVFPGQGSQSVGMLKAYAGLPGRRCGARGGARPRWATDFLKLLDEGPAEQLNLTVNTQPAMVTAAIAAYRAWIALGRPGAGDRRRPQPGRVLGAGRGGRAVVSRCAAAGALSRAVACRKPCRKGQGAMAAILGLDDDAVRAACAEAAQGEVVQAVNFNAPGQVVIAGHKTAVARAIEACKARGAKRAMPLPVSAPFHSSLMQPAAEKLGAYLEEMSLSRSRRFPSSTTST